MTAIAYKDGILAADSSCYAGETYQGEVTKLARTRDGAVAGASGDSTLCDEFLRLFQNSKADREWLEWRPTIVGSAQFSAVVVMPDGEIRQLDESGYFPVKAAFYTEGSASKLMIGAMAAGASAEEAVAIAIKYDAHCGGEVQVERLAGERPQGVATLQRLQAGTQEKVLMRVTGATFRA